ncbi:MAG: hypothetical protein WBE72_08020 [Terracidiphilus sp.]
MSISLRQTLAQLATHTHAYDGPALGLINYQSFLSYPSQYASMLIACRNPNEPPPGPAQTGPPDYSNG